MPYTPLLHFRPDIKERILSYLKEEIDNHEMERSGWVNDLKAAERLYWADPSKSVEPDPKMPLMQGANIIIPLVAIAVEMMQAKIMRKLFGLDQFVSVKLPDVWDDIDHDLERTLDHEFLVTADVQRPSTSACLDFLKYGTCVVKDGYVYETKKAVRQTEDGEDEYTTSVVVKKGLCIDHVQLVNFLMPFSAVSPEDAQWCGEVHTSSPYTIKRFVESGLFYPGTYEALQNYFWDLNTAGTAQSISYLREKENQENRSPIWPQRIHWYEIWFSFNVDGGSEDEEVEIVAYYHRDSNQLLGARYNDRVDVSRPYFVAANFPVEGRWTGIGQCKMGEQFQIEITTQHRQRIDAAAIAILRMFKAKKGKGISPNEPIFAGKIWMLEEMDDLDIFQTGEVYQSSYQNEQSAIMFWQQRSTVNELTLGMPQVGTPGTAASEMARLAEGNMRFDYTYDRFKSLITRVCLDGMCIIGKYGVRHDMWYEQLANGERVKEFLTQPPELIKNQIIITFRLAGQSSNTLLERANWTQLIGSTTQYYTNMLQIATQLGDQQLTQTVARKAMIAGTELMRQIYQSFDTRNIEKLLLTKEELGGGLNVNPATAIPGVAGIAPSPGLGFVNPVNTTPAGT